MNPEDIKIGLKVKTAPGLNSTSGFMIAEQFLQQRKANQLATVYGYVPGHGGDVWWLVHDGATMTKNGQGVDCYNNKFIAPYMFMEFGPVKT